MAAGTTFDPRVNQSYLSMQTRMDNFCPQFSAQLAVSNAGSTGSASITFPTITGTIRTTFKITNTGTKGGYLGWGSGSATAVASSGTPTANCDYIEAGAILTQDFQVAGGPVDTIAAICAGSDTTTLEISIGFGQ